MSPAPHPRMHGLTHVCGGPDPIPGICHIPDPSGTDLEDLILALGPDAFWKLNETTGLVAHDSSGNDHHLEAFGSLTAPNWGQDAGPPGDTTAGWATTAGTGVASPPAGPLMDFVDDFSCGIWVYIQPGGGGGELIGQGTAYHAGPGWCLMIVGTDLAVLVDGTPLFANDDLEDDTWYFAAVVRDAGTWKLYVNGLLQAATLTDDPGTGYGDDTWIGNDSHAAHTTWLHNCLLSYGFMVDTVLTSTQLLAMYEAGTGTGSLDDGLVWTTDGDGGASWQPVVESLNTLTGAVTLSAGLNITLTPAGQNIEIAASGGDPADATHAWMPLTTVVGGVPELVWDGDDQLIPTLTDL